MKSSQPLALGTTCVDATSPKVILLGCSRSVSLYNSPSLNLERTWALENNDKPTAIVFDPSTKVCHIAVTGKQHRLLSWQCSSEKATLREAASAMQVSQQIAALFPVRLSATDEDMMQDIERPEHLLLVFIDGSVGLAISGSLTSHLNSGTQTTSKYLNAVQLSEKNTFAVLTHNTSGVQCQTYSVGVNGRLQAVLESVTLAPPEMCSTQNKGKPAAGAIVNNRPVILYNDGALAVYSQLNGLNAEARPRLVEKSILQDIPQGLLGPSSSSSSSHAQTATKKRRNVNKDGNTSIAHPCIAALGKSNLFAVAGWSSQSVKVVLKDAVYGCTQSVVEVTADDLGLASVDNFSIPIQVLPMSGDRLAVVAGGGAAVVHVQLKAPSLANLVGSQAATSSGSLVHVGFAVLVGKVDDAKDLVQQGEVEWHVGDLEALHTAEQTALADLSVEVGKVLPIAVVERHVDGILSASKASKTAISQVVLGKILVGCAGAKMWKEVRKVLKAQQPSSLMHCTGMTSILVEEQEFDILECVLSHVTDTTSEDISALIKILLSRPTDATSKRFSAAVKDAEMALRAAEKKGGKVAALNAIAALKASRVSGFTSSQFCLHPLLLIPQDEGVLLRGLQQVNGSHAVALLKYLKQWLLNHVHILQPFAQGDDQGGGKGEVDTPSMKTILLWLSVVMDACMTQMIFKEDAALLFSDIRSLIHPQIKNMQALTRLKGAIEHMQCGAPLPAPLTRAGGDKYSIEVLDLRVM